MQQTVRRLLVFVISVALLSGLGVSPASAKSIDQGCETDARLHNSVRGELDGLCPTEDSPIDDSKTAKSGTISSKNVVPRNVVPRNVEPRNVEPRNVEPPQPRPIRTITEGQSTTFTVPNPTNRQLVERCANFTGAGGATPTPQFRSDGTLVCDYTIPVQRPDKPPGTNVNRTSVSTFGPCRGPYTVELLTLDSRLEHAGGTRIRVTTSTSDNLDDTGTIEVDYFLVGTSTRTFHASPEVAITTWTQECTLLQTARVKVNAARRRGMTAAVSRHAPAQGYLDTPSTTEWECTQAVIDAGVQCLIDSVVRTTIQPRFPTPSGCTVVVTVAKDGKGFGSTTCLTSAQIDGYEAEIRAQHSDEQAINVSDLPKCPESTHPDVMNELPADASGRKRCVARN